MNRKWKPWIIGLETSFGLALILHMYPNIPPGPFSQTYIFFTNFAAAALGTAILYWPVKQAFDLANRLRSKHIRRAVKALAVGPLAMFTLFCAGTGFLEFFGIRNMQASNEVYFSCVCGQPDKGCESAFSAANIFDLLELKPADVTVVLKRIVSISEKKMGRRPAKADSAEIQVINTRLNEAKKYIDKGLNKEAYRSLELTHRLILDLSRHELDPYRSSETTTK